MSSMQKTSRHAGSQKTDDPCRFVSFIPLPTSTGKDNKLLRLEINISLPDPISEHPIRENHESLLELWSRIKEHVREYDIQDYQIARWFSAVYQLRVGLVDFEAGLPPARLTREVLNRFYAALKRYTVSQ
jgi:hypothetical protein